MKIRKDLLRNRLCALTLFVVGALTSFLDGDGTALVLMSIFAVPLLFAAENWIL